DWQVAFPLAALSWCALLAALGIGSATSALLPYPAVAPGDSPFAQPQHGGGEAGKQALSLGLSLLVCLPAIGLVLAGMLLDPDLLLVAGIVGLVLGPVALVVGTELGARVVSRRAPELLAFQQQN